MAFSECLKLVARMGQADQDDLLKRVDDYIASGITPGEAQRMAGRDMLAEIEGDLKDVQGLADEQVKPAEAPALSRAEEAPAAEPEPQAGPGFYSALRRELAKAKTNASPADYWTNLIKGAINKGAVKAEDVRLSGVEGWLAEHSGKVPKTAVAAWLDERAQVEEAGVPAEEADPVETPEFKKWFGDSKVVDAAGKPLVVYHGTQKDFDRFKDGTGWFTSDPSEADFWGGMGAEGANIVPAYLSIKNPRILQASTASRNSINDALAALHNSEDGVLVMENGAIRWAIVADPEQVKSATGNNGQFDATNPDIRFSRNQPYAQSQVGAWKIADDSRFTKFIYNIQDKHIDTRDVTKAIQASVGALGDRENAALRETLYLGRVTDRQKRFLEDELKPINTMLHAAGLTYKDLGEYLHARHAQERNAAMMAINPGRIDNDALSGMTDADAQRILAGAAPALPRIAARVDAIIEGTRHLMEVAGLETPDTVQALRDAYTNYAPLHRDEANPDHRMAQGQGFSVKGSNVKRATGSTATVDHELILAHIAEAREATIVRAEKNLVGLSLYSLAMRNPNPDFWSTDNPPTISKLDDRKEVYNPGTKQMMANPKYNTVVQVTDPMYKAKDNVLVVKVNGEDRTITFNEHNDRALRMVESLKNLDVDKVGAMVQTIGKATRYLAAINTQYNPVFAITNNMRDIQEALINMRSAGIDGKKAQVLKDTYANALWAVGAVERKGAAATGQWADLYRELSARGGLTGYRESFETIHDRLESIRSELAKQTESAGKKALLAAPRAIGGAVSVLNTAVENSVRLAVYKAALDSGMTKDQAAAAAKGITVNFNRKGQMSNQFGSLYAFFNAAVQGTARTVHTLRSPGGKLIMSGAILAGFLQAMLMGAQPDDEEENIKEFTKDLNYVVPLSWAGQAGKYLTIPMAQGMKALVGLGRHMGEMVSSMKDGKRVDPLKHVAGIISLAMDSYNPLGNAPTLGQLAAPTLFKPVVQLAENKSWTGDPIYRERGPYGQFKSGSSLGRDNTAKPYKVAADLINRASGGTEKTRDAMAPAWASPQPEALRLLVETVGGGVMRETNKLFEYGMSKVDSSKEPVDTNRVPLVGRFLADTTTNAAPTSKYYENINEVEKRAKTLKDIEDSAAADAFEKKFPEVALEKQASRLRKEIGKLRAERREAAIEGVPDRELKTYDADIAERMREFNKDFRETVNAR